MIMLVLVLVAVFSRVLFCFCFFFTFGVFFLLANNIPITLGEENGLFLRCRPIGDCFQPHTHRPKCW